MERFDFLLREAIRSPEMELKIRAVFSENTALHEEVSLLKDENAILKERLAWFEKQTHGSYHIFCAVVVDRNISRLQKTIQVSLLVLCILYRFRKIRATGWFHRIKPYVKSFKYRFRLCLTRVTAFFT